MELHQSGTRSFPQLSLISLAPVKHPGRVNKQSLGPDEDWQAAGDTGKRTALEMVSTLCIERMLTVDGEDRLHPGGDYLGTVL